MEVRSSGPIKGRASVAQPLYGADGIRFETICAAAEFLARADDPAVLLARRLADAERTTLGAFGTEAGLLQRTGIPTVVCGPGHIAQAHQVDEYRMPMLSMAPSRP